MLLPTFRVGPTLVWLDPEAYVACDFELYRGSDSEQCPSCGQDIVRSGSLLGNPPEKVRTEPSPLIDDCVVECDCGETWEIRWKEIS